MKIKKLNESSQARSSRFNTYKNRIEKAIKKGDAETLQRTKEAIMYAPAKELKASEAKELMDMIKGSKLQESKEKVFTKKNGDYLVRCENGGHSAYSSSDVFLGHINDEDTDEASFKFEKNKFDESRSLKEEMWDKSRVTDLVRYYLDRSNMPINTLANKIRTQMEDEGSKLPFNITDFYDVLYMEVDNYNSQFDESLKEASDTFTTPEGKELKSTSYVDRFKDAVKTIAWHKKFGKQGELTQVEMDNANKRADRLRMQLFELFGFSQEEIDTFEEEALSEPLNKDFLEECTEIKEGFQPADEWYLKVHPEDREGAAELKGLFIDDVIKDKGNLEKYGFSDRLKGILDNEFKRYSPMVTNESKSIKTLGARGKKLNEAHNPKLEGFIPDDAEYERVDRSGTDEERLVTAVSYMYGVDTDTAKEYIPDLGDTQRKKALAYYDLRDLPRDVRLSKIKELYPRVRESFEGGYKKGDKVELSNGQTGKIHKDVDYNVDDRAAVEIDGMNEIKYPLIDTLRLIRESADYKVKFFQVFEAPKSPTEDGKMIGQRGTLEDANAFGKEKVGEGKYIIKAVCDDGQTRNIDNDTDDSAYTLAESNDVQYGVHQFSTDSIIFIGTEEECGKYIDNNKKLWDDAEVYRMTPDDPHYKKIEEAYADEPYGAYDVKRLVSGRAPDYWWVKKEIEMDFGDGAKVAAYLKKKGVDLKFDSDNETWFVKGQYHFTDCYFYPYAYRYEDQAVTTELSEASYGGAFDIEDDQYFTKEDLLAFADEVLGHVAETFNGVYDIGGVWFEDGNIITQIVADGGEEYEDVTRVDMRRIREPWHLKRIYASSVAANIIQQIKDTDGDVITENIRGMGEYSDKFHDYLNFLMDEGKQDNIAYLASQLIRYCKEEDLKDLWLDRMSKTAEMVGFEASSDDLDEGLMDEFHKAQRWLDFEIPDMCKTVADKLPDMPEGAMMAINKHCMRFKDGLESVIDRADESLTESVTDAETIEAGPAVGMAAVISDLIKDEYEAIDGYNSAIATAEAEGFGDAVKVLSDIQAEENIHIGQLQEVMKMFDPNAENVMQGQEEGEDQLSVNPDDLI